MDAGRRDGSGRACFAGGRARAGETARRWMREEKRPGGPERFAVRSGDPDGAWPSSSHRDIRQERGWQSR